MRIFILFYFILITNICIGQFQYKEIPSNYIKKVSLDEKYDIYKSKAINLTKYLPKGYKTDGTIDYTSYLQKGLDQNRIVILPNFPLAINFQGLKLKSNSVVIFQEATSLNMIPNNRSGYSLISIVGQSNVKLYNPVLKGDRKKHTGKTGEWGMGINIGNSSEVKILNSNIFDFWGDGIYIGGNRYSSNIQISGGLINNNRRNGITIISGENINISNLVVGNSNGANPMTGIDIEPNSDQNRKVEVNINSVVTYNNKVSGLTINLNHLKSKTLNNLVNININNFTDNNSNFGISYSNINSKIKRDLEGFINMVDINLKGNIKPIRFMNDNSSLGRIKMNTNKITINHSENSKYMNDLNTLKTRNIIYNTRK